MTIPVRFQRFAVPDLQAPAVNVFGMLSEIGDSITKANDKRLKAKEDYEAGELLARAFDAQLGGQQPTSKAGALLDIAQPRAAGPVPAGSATASGTPRKNIERGTVHVAETEEDVQRLERATGMNVDQDLDKVVRTVYGEAAGEGIMGQRAVASVIANRSRQSGMTPTDVVLAKGQFEPWSDPAARARMESLDPNSPEYKQLAALVEPVLRGQAADPTGGATHFYAPKAQAALGRKAPSWDDGTGRDIGNHRFFSHGYGPQGQVQLAQADAPAPGAKEAQFVVPGQQAPRAGGLSRELLVAMARNPQTRAMAGELIRGLAKGEVKTVDLGTSIGVMDNQGNLIRQIPKSQNPVSLAQGSVLVDPSTGREIYRSEKPPEAPTTRQIKQADGSEVTVQWDPESRQWIPMPAPQGGAVVQGPPKLTETQSKDVGFYNRGSKIIDRLDQQDQELTDGFSAVGGNVSNFLKTDTYRRAEQTGREFLAVILRKDTGAAVTPQEMEQYGSIYLPRPGDDAATIQQKREARRTALEGIRMGLGTAEILFKGQGGAQEAPQQAPNAPNVMAPSRADLEAEARRRGLLK